MKKKYLLVFILLLLAIPFSKCCPEIKINLPQKIEIGVKGIECSSPYGEEYLIKENKGITFIWKYYYCKLRSGESARFLLQIRKRDNITLEDTYNKTGTLRLVVLRNCLFSLGAHSTVNFTKNNVEDINLIIRKIGEMLQNQEISW